MISLKIELTKGEANICTLRRWPKFLDIGEFRFAVFFAKNGFLCLLKEPKILFDQNAHLCFDLPRIKNRFDLETVRRDR